MDSIGLAAFTTTGTVIGLQYHNFFLALFAGVVTAAGGGTLRDLFSGQKPDIFVRHFYACASLIGAIIIILLYKISPLISCIIGPVVVFVLRIIAAKNKWNLPHVSDF